MAPLRTYLLPAMAAVAAVQAANIDDYFPGCAPKCLNEAVANHSTCEPDDGDCLCRDIYSLKRHSEECLEDACSDAEYGEAMLGFDNFCKDGGDGGSDPAPTTTANPPPPEEPTVKPPPPPEPTVEPPPPPQEPTVKPPPPPEEPTVKPPPPPEEPTVKPPPQETEEPSDPTTTEGTTTVPSPTAVPSPTTTGGDGGEGGGDGSEGGGDGSEGGGDGSDGGDEPTESSPPGDGAGATLSSSFGVLAGALMVAAYFGL